MAEYINKREAMDAILQHCKLTMEKAVDSPKQLRDIYMISHNQCIMVLQTLMPADVVERELYQKTLSDVIRLSVERKHGKWVFGFDEETGEQDLYAWTCSLCGDKYPWQPNFCPNCGADMRGDSNE